MRNGRSRDGPGVEHGVHVADEQDPRSLPGPVERGHDRVAEASGGIGPDLDRGPERRSGRPPPSGPTSLTPSGVYDPQSMLTRLLEIGQVLGEIVGDRGPAAHPARARRSGLDGHRSSGSLRVARVAILPGPCVWSRSACSRDPTSTGWSRWSSWSSPIGRRRTWYGQRDPGRHALVRPRGRRAQPRLARSASPRSRPGSAGCECDHGEGRAGLAVHRSSDPGHWIVTFPWSGRGACPDPRPRPRSPSRNATSRHRGPRGSPAPRNVSWPAGRSGSPRRGRHRPRGSAMPTDASRSCRSRGRTASRPSRASITHILLARRAPRRARRPPTACSSTSGWSSRATGPGPAARSRSSAAADIDVAVLETARGGIVLRGMGYESNDASVLTNVSSDHLDLQGIHTLPELAEVKSTVCRITKPDGWVVLNGDDPLVAAVSRRVRARVAYFSPQRPRRVRRSSGVTSRAAAAPTSSADGWLIEIEGGDPRRRRGRSHPDHDRRAGAAQRRERAGRRWRRARPGRDDRAGPRWAARLPAVGRPVTGPAQPVPSRFAARDRRLRAQRGRASRPCSMSPRASRAVPPVGPHRSPRSSARPGTAPTTRCAGSAGSPPSGPSGSRSRRPASTCEAGPRPRWSASCARGSRRAASRPRMSRSTSPRPSPCGRNWSGAAADTPRVIVLMCHEEREGVFRLLDDLGARAVDVTAELTTLVPRLQERPRRA